MIPFEAYHIHDTFMTALGRFDVGQNLASGHDSFIQAIHAWHSEVKDFSYSDEDVPVHLIGHYTQVSLFFFTFILV